LVMSTVTRVILILALPVLVFSCQRPAERLTLETPEMFVTKADHDQAWDEILEVLREHDFTPEYVNPRFGIIRTYPTISQQWFEFWRADAQGWYQWLESSLHTIRRHVQVKFTPKDDRYKVDVTVYVQRKSQPERQVTTASGALQIYGEKLPIYTGEKLAAGEGVHWVDLGTDQALADYLVERIERRLAGHMMASSAEEGAPEEAASEAGGETTVR